MVFPVFLLFFCWPLLFEGGRYLGGLRNEQPTRLELGRLILNSLACFIIPRLHNYFSGSDRRRGAPSAPSPLSEMHQQEAASCHHSHYVPGYQLSHQAGGREQDFRDESDVPLISKGLGGEGVGVD